MSKKVFINAGHGPKGVNDSDSNGYDPGAIGATGYKESTETKEISDLVSKNLESNGIETLVYQDGDLYDVTNKSNSWGSDYFVSIHCNSFDANSHGVETFSLSSMGEGVKLAKAVHKKLVPATGLYDRGLKTANYHVLRETDCPAILTEIGFISNPTEEALMKNSTWDINVANAISEGICDFLGVKYLENNEQNNNNQGDDNVENAILGFSIKDIGAVMLVSEKLGNCAMYFRDSNKNFNQDCLKSETLYVVGGSSVGHKKEVLLSGNAAKDTLQQVINIL